jgi:hypothetical protein
MYQGLLHFGKSKLMAALAPSIAYPSTPEGPRSDPQLRTGHPSGFQNPALPTNFPMFYSTAAPQTINRSFSSVPIKRVSSNNHF